MMTEQTPYVITMQVIGLDDTIIYILIGIMKFQNFLLLPIKLLKLFVFSYIYRLVDAPWYQGR